jgi:hypothetical protein
MTRKMLIASMLAAALALAPAAPAIAQPGGEDYAKVLLGLLAAGAIVNALQNERERERQAQRNRYQPVEWERDRHHGHNHRRGQGRFVLPARCEFEVRTRRGWTDVLGKTCLENEGVRVSRLPDACAFEVRTERGRRTVYGERCLRDFGYRVEAGRR